MDEVVEPATLTTHEPLFRASKRRKIFRRRETGLSPAAEAQQAGGFPEPQTDPDASETTEAAHSTPGNITFDETRHTGFNEALRKRKAARSRRGGVEFSREKDAKPEATQEDDSHALIQREDAPSALVEASQRFAPQTGVVSEKHDRHM